MNHQNDFLSFDQYRQFPTCNLQAIVYSLYLACVGRIVTFFLIFSVTIFSCSHLFSQSFLDQENQFFKRCEGKGLFIEGVFSPIESQDNDSDCAIMMNPSSGEQGTAILRRILKISEGKNFNAAIVSRQAPNALEDIAQASDHDRISAEHDAECSSEEKNISQYTEAATVIEKEDEGEIYSEFVPEDVRKEKQSLEETEAETAYEKSEEMSAAARAALYRALSLDEGTPEYELAWQELSQLAKETTKAWEETAAFFRKKYDQVPEVTQDYWGRKLSCAEKRVALWREAQKLAADEVSSYDLHEQLPFDGGISHTKSKNLCSSTNNCTESIHISSNSPSELNCCNPSNPSTSSVSAIMNTRSKLHDIWNAEFDRWIARFEADKLVRVVTRAKAKREGGDQTGNADHLLMKRGEDIARCFARVDSIRVEAQRKYQKYQDNKKSSILRKAQATYKQVDDLETIALREYAAIAKRDAITSAREEPAGVHIIWEQRLDQALNNAEEKVRIASTSHADPWADEALRTAQRMVDIVAAEKQALNAFNGEQERLAYFRKRWIAMIEAKKKAPKAQCPNEESCVINTSAVEGFTQKSSSEESYDEVPVPVSLRTDDSDVKEEPLATLEQTRDAATERKKTMPLSKEKRQQLMTLIMMGKIKENLRQKPRIKEILRKKSGQLLVKGVRTNRVTSPAETMEGGYLRPDLGSRIYNGLVYTEHALERMAPNTPEVIALLQNNATKRRNRATKRAVENWMDSQEGSLKDLAADFQASWKQDSPQTRGILPSVVEAEIANPGTTDVRVVTSKEGHVITVIRTKKPGRVGKLGS